MKDYYPAPREEQPKQSVGDTEQGTPSSSTVAEPITTPCTVTDAAPADAAPIFEAPMVSSCSFPPIEPAVPKHSRAASARQIVSVCGGVAAITLLSALAQVVLAVLVRQFMPTLLEESWFLLGFSSLTMYGIAMPLSLILFRVGRSEPPVGGGRVRFAAFLGLVALCFGITVAGNMLSSVVQGVISSITGEPPVNDIQELTMQTPFWANLLFAGILAPILEEIFFRKLVIDRLRHFGDLPAVLISGVLFGLIHGNFSQFFYAAMFGILAGYVYIYTGKLRYTVALHMILNLVGGVITTEILRLMYAAGYREGGDMMAFFMEHPIETLPYLLYSGFMMACLIACPIAIALMCRRVRFQKRPEAPERGEIFLRFLRNPATWVLVVTVALIFSL